jgi:CO dehydrogenase nickel-insertion accessory protein CooC1
MLKEFQEYSPYVFVGHFGSGKTEIAANFAQELIKYNKDVYIVDMDIVNPFFRTVDLKEYFGEEGIHLIASEYAGTNVEASFVPSNISSLIEQKDSKVILDIGGDDAGAKILSTYSEYVQKTQYRMYCVVNTKRPDTNSASKIISMTEQINAKSNLKINAFINNTNLAGETTLEDVIEGQEILQEVSKKINVPIAFICANEGILDRLAGYDECGRIPHRIKVKLPWE